MVHLNYVLETMRQKGRNMNKNEIILFETDDHTVKLNVSTDGNTVWLNRAQLAELFDRDIKTIGKHINNAIKEELSEDDSVVAKFATTASDGKTYQVDYYNLDVIISVGYRVKSQRGVEFRKWANKVLKDYIIKGYAVNNKRIAAAMFLYFLDNNNALFLDDAKTEKAIADQTLAALTIMIAESQPAEKEMMISVIMNCMMK